MTAKSEIYKRILPLLIFLIILLCFGSELFAQKVFINEFLASNATTNPDIVDFDEYPDWIELYNAENASIDIGGFYLTDNFNFPQKWEIPQGTIIPANGFLRIWADGKDDKPGTQHTRTSGTPNTFTTTWYHTNFKLSRGGEEIGLYDANEILIDSIEYGLQDPDVSYGRKPDGSNSWVYFGEPTPGEVNLTAGVVEKIYTEEPEFSINGGLHTGIQNLKLNVNSANGEIRYTTDGSKPTSSSELYQLNIPIFSTTVIRARTFEDNKLPSKIGTHSYIINEQTELPVLSITAFPNTLFGGSFGIYNNSLKGKEIPITLEFFEPDNGESINYDCGLRISGQASYLYPQKPLTLSADDRFGAEFFDYKFFPNREIDNYTEIYLRNSGTPDNRRTLFRDALQHSIVINQMDIDCQAYRPVMSFINGEYWGLYNLREKLNADYIAAHHNIDPANIDYLEIDFSLIPVEIEGDAFEYNELLNFVKNNDLSITKNYDYVKSQIDINEYLNYQITEIFCDNINWLNTNVRWWKEKSENGKWRWVLLDLDWGFGTVSPGFTSHYTTNTIEMATSAQGSELELYPWATILFRNLLENFEFKSEFIQRFAGYLNTIFSSERVLHIADSIKSQIGSQMFRHIERWKDSGFEDLFGDPPIMNLTEWETDVAIMRAFAANRPTHQRNHIISFFELSGTANVTINNTNPGSGRVVINNVNIPNDFSGLYFKDIPLSVTAIPKVGYRFVRWQGVSASTSSNISITLDGDAILLPVFEADDASIIPAQISINTVLRKSGSPFYAESDILISPGTTLTVEAGVEINMSENSNILVFGQLNINGTEDEKVIIKPNSNSGSTTWGALNFIETTNTSELSHVKLIGATNGIDNKDYRGAISGYKSDLILNNIEIDDAPFPIFIKYGSVELRNSRLHSEKTCDLINVKYATNAVIENNLFRGNNSYDTDAIDYDGIEGGEIKGNRIYNFFGENSDGIDLGERSKDILIQDNLIYNCYDKGISVGQASTTDIKNNIIVNCAQGVGVKDDSSFANIENTTFYANDYAVASFEKNYGAGGGNAKVVNSILANSQKKSILLDNLSVLEISYSLSDTDELEGVGNIYADPNFKNNFLLSQNSLAIDSGNPASPTDSDGSITDMGVKEYSTQNDQDLIINEIHFNPVNGLGNQFVEIFNSGTSTINISGFKIKGRVDFEFPNGSTIEEGEYIIVSKSSSNYNNNGYQVFEWGDEELSNYWSDIELYNNENNLVDLVSYSYFDGITNFAKENGTSLEMKSDDLENLYSKNWQTSYNIGGSPGKINEPPQISDLFINEFMAININSYADENSEFDDWIEIYNNSDNVINIGGLYISDDLADSSFYQIPNDNPQTTVIKPKERLILWADQQTSQGPLHLDFKLNGLGESIYLTQKIDENFIIIDSISYPEQIENISYARTQDGVGEWETANFVTPQEPNSLKNVFNKGILLVNGISIAYGDEILNAFTNKAYWGKFPITFWDCFDFPFVEYPKTLPEAVGHGSISFDELKKYSTVIWLGNNYTGDLDYWKLSEIKKYVESGGNLLLIARRGRSFIDEELADYIGVKWVYDDMQTITNCIPVYEGLDTITVTGNQSWNAIFETTLTGSESELLFTETASFTTSRGIGVWKKPSKGGAYRENGGQLIFLSGRPYRYDSFDLRKNIEYMLENFFDESENPVIDTTNIGDLTSFNLYQNYPNPFNPRTTIVYDVVEETKVELNVYNILGQKVNTLINEVQSFGRKSIIWDGTNNSGKSVSSGVYIYSIKIGNWVKSKKMILLR